MVLRASLLFNRRALLNSRHLLSKDGPKALFSASSALSVPDEVTPPDHLSSGERAVFAKLKSALEPLRLEVQDISGGCGSMYGLDIVSPKFQGMTIIKQHQLVNKILAEDIAQWHGVQLKTKAG